MARAKNNSLPQCQHDTVKVTCTKPPITSFANSRGLVWGQGDLITGDEDTFQEIFGNRRLEIHFDSTFSTQEPAGTIWQSASNYEQLHPLGNGLRHNYWVTCALPCCPAATSSHAHQDHYESSTFPSTPGWAGKDLCSGETVAEQGQPGWRGPPAEERNWRRQSLPAQ